MNHSSGRSKVTMYETRGCLVVPVQEELSREAALQIQESMLDKIHKKSVKGVVIDLSGVNVIDSALWIVFSKTTQMIRMLGFSTIITGLSPGVVASLIDLDLDVDDVETAMRLEDALDIFSQIYDSGISENEADNNVEISVASDVNS
jgi:rsbT antagonist protein RsbS